MRSLSPLVVLVLLLGACAGGPRGTQSTIDAISVGEEEVEEILLGTLIREEIEAALPDWVAAQVDSEVDVSAAIALADVVTERGVTVFFGSWCSDSRRELARLWRAFDTTGAEPSFAIRYIGVDRSKKQPQELIGDAEILFVPTFVVEEDGTEVGRIIESAPSGIEQDLLSLLGGTQSGWISGRDDLPAAEESSG